MPTFELAHVSEQGQQMLLFPLDSSIHYKTDSEKNDILYELEMRSHGAGLAGSAALFWVHAGHTKSFGPTHWKAFLRSMDFNRILRSVNKSISW